MRGSRSTTGASETRSTYGSTARTSRTSSRPPHSRAGPSNIINVDQDNGNDNDDGDAAEAPVTSTSARRRRSVASAPARPSGSLTPFPAPNYSQSAYADIFNLRDIVDIDSWRKTAPFPHDTMRTAPDTSFDESGTPGSAPSYQWYGKTEVATFPKALVDWRKCDEDLEWEYRNSLVETNLPDQIARLNRMHRESCGIDDLIHVADGIDLFFKYRRFWTAAKMRRSAPSAISFLELIRDLQKVCQTNNQLFADRAPFLAYKVDLLLRRHQLRGL